jgi:hypothetical protein
MTISGKSRNGNYCAKYRTNEKKLKTKRAKVKKWIRQNMHTPIGELIKKLNIKLRGHYNYYELSHNFKKLNGFLHYVKRTLFKVLNRRGDKKKLNRERFGKILQHNPLLTPKITVPLW